MNDTATRSLSADFHDRESADRAAERLVAAGVVSVEVGADDATTSVRATGLDPASAGKAKTLLDRAAGRRGLVAEYGAGERDPDRDPAHAPRPVQAGFADVRPGYTPKSLEADGATTGDPDGRVAAVPDAAAQDDAKPSR